MSPFPYGALMPAFLAGALTHYFPICILVASIPTRALMSTFPVVTRTHYFLVC